MDTLDVSYTSLWGLLHYMEMNCTYDDRVVQGSQSHFRCGTVDEWVGVAGAANGPGGEGVVLTVRQSWPYPPPRRWRAAPGGPEFETPAVIDELVHYVVLSI